MIDERFTHTMAVAFFEAALSDESGRAHELTDAKMNCDPIFWHDFDGSLFYSISLFKDLLIKKFPETEKFINELCHELRHGKTAKKERNDWFSEISKSNTKKSKKGSRFEEFYLPDQKDEEDKFGQ